MDKPKEATSEQETKKNCPSRCIFCFRTEDEVSFRIEHIIPDAIGGRLKLEKYVCFDCNSWLGANVDHHIQRVPDILTALHKIGDIERLDHILKSNYDATLESQSGDKFRAHADSKGFYLLPQKNSAGNIIWPEKRGTEILKKSLQRQDINADETCKEKEIERICKFAENSIAGEKFIPDSIPFEFEKHSEKLKPNLVPKALGDPNALIAKIAYEFMFFVGSARFFQVKGLAERLLEEIEPQLEKKNDVKMFINRVKSLCEEPRPYHFIRFEHHPKCPPMLTVGFYGTLAYHLVIFVTLPEDFFKEIADYANFPSMIGIQYQGGIGGNKYSSEQAFWALGPDGKSKQINDLLHYS
ncbi:MAG TPA: HNH endonuclease [Acidobacteriota bacterium]|nr:HNH endonuclease [Acidobacteriota bacterium]HNT17791.1 HNH endonuclease [Acidobacteriota bacterium]